MSVGKGCCMRFAFFITRLHQFLEEDDLGDFLDVSKINQIPKLEILLLEQGK